MKDEEKLEDGYVARLDETNFVIKNDTDEIDANDWRQVRIYCRLIAPTGTASRLTVGWLPFRPSRKGYVTPQPGYELALRR